MASDKLPSPQTPGIVPGTFSVDHDGEVSADHFADLLRSALNGLEMMRPGGCFRWHVAVAHHAKGKSGKWTTAFEVVGEPVQSN